METADPVLDRSRGDAPGGQTAPAVGQLAEPGHILQFVVRIHVAVEEPQNAGQWPSGLRPVLERQQRAGFGATGLQYPVIPTADCMRLATPSEPRRMSSFQHGWRAWLTCKSTPPNRTISPT